MNRPLRLTLISILLTVALAAMPVMPAGAVGTQVTLTSGTSWTVPAGVHYITIECWGAGGNGGAVSGLYASGGGGGGGAYAKVLSYAVTPGDVIPYSIGAGGAGAQYGGANKGGNTTFNTNVCVADGGSGVANNSTNSSVTAGGAGGLASASTGDIKANGGSGYTGTALGGGGGGSAGVTAMGLTSGSAIAGNGATSCTGATAVTNGGAGGSGACSGATQSGSAPVSGLGGGGGGAHRGGGGNATAGGSGAKGQIVITYLPSITTPTAINIGTTSATLGANFVSANGGTPTARGICWGTTPAPTTNCTSSGTTTGVYTQSVSGLTAGTSYYYRGYVTDESGTSYSEDGTFIADTTLAVTAPSSVTYPATGTLTASGGSSGGTVSFNYVSGGCSLGGADNATLTITNASSTPCVVTATRAAGGNYVAQTSANYNVTLVRANSTISVNGPFSFTYNSSPQGPDTATVTGSGGAVTYSYGGTGSTTYGPSSTKPTNAGTYDVTATLAADNNYNGASSSATAFTIATPTATATATNTATATATATNTPTATAVATNTPTPTTASVGAPAAPVFVPPPGSQSVGASGGTFGCTPWFVVIDPGNAPAGSALDCGSLNTNAVPPAPTGVTFLRAPENVILYDSNGNRLTSFNPPLQMCYTYSDAELAAAGGDPANFVVITSPEGGTTWEQLPTTVDVAAHRVCGSTTHLTRFALSAKAPTSLPVTGENFTPFIIIAALIFALAIVAAGVLARRRKIESLKH